jgi:hypothetical protein
MPSNAAAAVPASPPAVAGLEMFENPPPGVSKGYQVGRVATNAESTVECPAGEVSCAAASTL